MKNKNNESVIETIAKVLKRTLDLVSPLTVILLCVSMIKEMLSEKSDDK